jgi:hypothetical protein
MAYTYTNSKGKKYFLHVKKMERASGKVTELYYFSTDPIKATLWINSQLARSWSN